MPLLADIARCHDAQCIDRHTCLRWQERDSGTTDRTPHAATMRPDGMPPADRCPYKLPDQERGFSTPFVPPAENRQSPIANRQSAHPSGLLPLGMAENPPPIACHT